MTKHHMKKLTLLLLVITLSPLVSNKATGGATIKQDGEYLFKKHCLACHPDVDKLKSTKNIIGKMRNPVSSMPEFDENKISNENARKIDDYIHQEFDCATNQYKNNRAKRK
jgi:mono/diheme cytochrome c family protein